MSAEHDDAVQDDGAQEDAAAGTTVRCHDRLWHGFEFLSDNPVLSDITLEFEDQQFRAHKVVLAAHSDYFKVLFTCDTFVESNQHSIKLLEDDAQALRAMLSWMYNKSVLPVIRPSYEGPSDEDCDAITRLGELFTVADKYQVSGLGESAVSELMKVFEHKWDNARVKEVVALLSRLQPGSLRPHYDFILNSLHGDRFYAVFSLYDYDDLLMQHTYFIRPCNLLLHDLRKSMAMAKYCHNCEFQFIPDEKQLKTPEVELECPSCLKMGHCIEE